MQNASISQVIEYIWIPIVMSIVAVWRRLSGADTRVQLLEQARVHHDEQRREERDMRDTQHQMIMKKLDGLEVRIKNGH